MSYLDRFRGPEKTASTEEAAPLDLSAISGADLLAGLEDGSIVLTEPESEEPTVTPAEEPTGIEALTDEQLATLAAELEGPEKTAADEEAAYWDAAGRTFARGFLAETAEPEITGDTNIHDVLEKVAAKFHPIRGSAGECVKWDAGEKKWVPATQKEADAAERMGADYNGPQIKRLGMIKNAGVDKTVRGMGDWLIKNVTPMGRRNVEAVEQVGKQTGKLKKAIREVAGGTKINAGSEVKDLLKNPALATDDMPGVQGRLKKLIKAKGDAGATASSKLGQRVAGYGALGLGGAAAVGTTAAVASKLTD